MYAIQKFLDFLKQLFSFNTKPQMPALPAAEEAANAEQALNAVEDEISKIQEKRKDKVNVEKRTLLTRLDMIEQEISLFENEFPDEYNKFKVEIQTLKQAYNDSLGELSKELRFEIDPDIDSFKTGRVIRLEKEVRKFIECQVKFRDISNCLQRLIVKLNILYNVSIFHSRDSDRRKVISQLEHAIASMTKIAEEFKESDHILADKQLKERVVELISYADYLIFKTTLRNNRTVSPYDCSQRLVILDQFYGFNYIEAFKSFVQNEICDLDDLIDLLEDKKYGQNLKKTQDALLNQLTYQGNLKDVILDRDFWNAEFDFESGLLEMLKLEENVDKDKIKVEILSRMNVAVTEDEVVVLPITQTFMYLMSVFSKTHDQRVFALMKVLKGVSQNVTYKEIYFLLQLFDLVDVVKDTSKELTKHIQKYLEKYPYDSATIKAKMRSVKSASDKEYVVMLKLDNYAKQIIDAMEKLNFDFKVAGDDLLVNSFYFLDLTNVLSSFQSNTQNTTI